MKGREWEGGERIKWIKCQTYSRGGGGDTDTEKLERQREPVQTE